MWQWHCTTFSIFAFDVTGPMLYKCVNLTHLYNIGPVTSNANILNVVQCHCHMDRVCFVTATYTDWCIAITFFTFLLLLFTARC